MEGGKRKGERRERRREGGEKRGVEWSLVGGRKGGREGRTEESKLAGLEMQGLDSLRDHLLRASIDSPRSLSRQKNELSSSVQDVGIFSRSHPCQKSIMDEVRRGEKVVGESRTTRLGGEFSRSFFLLANATNRDRRCPYMYVFSPQRHRGSETFRLRRKRNEGKKASETRRASSRLISSEAVASDALYHHDGSLTRPDLWNLACGSLLLLSRRVVCPAVVFLHRRIFPPFFFYLDQSTNDLTTSPSASSPIEDVFEVRESSSHFLLLLRLLFAHASSSATLISFFDLFQ